MRPRHLVAVAKGVAVALITSTLAFGTAAGATYPSKPMRLVIGYPPGGSSDMVARDFAKRLYENLGQPVVVDNRPGASGVLAANMVSRAQPDGHTMLIVPSTFYNNIVLRPSMTLDPFKDLDAVAKVAIVANVAVVPTSLPASTIRDFIALAKAKPGSFSFASGGVGTTHHLAIELLKKMVGMDVVHVPYKGTPPALLDVIAGRVQLMLAGAPPTVPLVRDGKLKAIGVSTLKRLPDLPDVPAIAESVPNFEATLGYVMLVPARTPKAVIGKLNAELLKILLDPSAIEQLTRAGFIPDGMTPADTERYLKAEFDKWANVIKTAHIKIE